MLLHWQRLEFSRLSGWRDLIYPRAENFTFPSLREVLVRTDECRRCSQAPLEWQWECGVPRLFHQLLGMRSDSNYSWPRYLNGGSNDLVITRCCLRVWAQTSSESSIKPSNPHCECNCCPLNTQRQCQHPRIPELWVGKDLWRSPRAQSRQGSRAGLGSAQNTSVKLIENLSQ